MRRNTTAAGYGYRWQRLRLRILARDRGICHYCGGRANSVDHVTPKIEGGTDSPANLVAACTSCNSRRSLAWIRTHRGARVADAVISRGARARAGGTIRDGAPPAPDGPVFWCAGAGLMIMPRLPPA